MAEVRTRLANLADAPVVLRMIRGLAQHLDQGDDFTATLDDVRRDGFGPDPRYESVLAEIGARPAGLATYFPMYSTFRGRPFLYLDCLYVEDWARGQKLGRALMAHVYRTAKARDCCRIELNVAVNNPARRFYESIAMALNPDLPYVVREKAFSGLTG